MLHFYLTRNYALVKRKKMHVFVCVCMRLRTVNFKNLSFYDWKPIYYISNFVLKVKTKKSVMTDYKNGVIY